MKKIKNPDVIAFNIIGYSFIIFASIICFLPFLLVLSGSFSSEALIRKFGYGILPRGLTLEAYNIIFKAPETILRAYGVTIGVVAVGTGLALIIAAMTGYVLTRNYFKYRYKVSFFFYFTTLFGGGIIASYIIISSIYQLKNTFWVMIFPGLVPVFHIYLMRNFIRTIPDSISESAKMDGAGEWTIFYKLYFPLMKPALASVALFKLIGEWNDYFGALIYISDKNLYPLQYLLYKMIQQTENLQMLATIANIPAVDVPSETMKLAMTMIATGPILIAYPFFQKHFVKGLTMGSVKG